MYNAPKKREREASSFKLQASSFKLQKHTDSPDYKAEG
jgi:hypothetical protein